MQYMLLIYSAESGWTPESREACFQKSLKLSQELHAKGQFVAAAPLQFVHTATSVRVREGKRAVTDGPFAETREQLGGFYIVDVANLDEAIEIAARIPAAALGTVEIRPVHELQGIPGQR